LRDSPLLAACSKTGSVVFRILHSDRLPQFVKFCLVGGSGVFVDMGVLFLLADPRCLGLGVTLSKICSAEAALISNFVWNERWTFREATPPPASADPREGRAWKGILARLVSFNAICGVGIALAVLLLHIFHSLLCWDLYLSNAVAILTATFWNFGMNARFNWPGPQGPGFLLRCSGLSHRDSN